MSQQLNSVQQAILGHATQDGGVPPDAQLNLDRSNLGDRAGLLDLSDADVAQSNRLYEAVTFQ